MGENREFHGINGGSKVMTGFARNTVLSVADTVVDAVKSGAIRHFFLVGGCDGSRPGRNYYTEFVRQTPPDTVILTLACGKYRFNDLDLGTIGGLPRVMDIGQCNDAYSAIQIALALADAFDLRRQRPAPEHDFKLVRAESGLHPSDPASPGNQRYPSGAHLPAFISPQRTEFPCGKI